MKSGVGAGVSDRVLVTTLNGLLHPCRGTVPTRVCVWVGV